MEKTIEFTPAFDKRNPDPKKNYGIHGCNMLMVLSGSLGAVHFILFTHWHLPSIEEESKTAPDSVTYKHHYPFTYVNAPLPAEIGYHSPVPMREGQKPVTNCKWIKGGNCYSDINSTMAKKVFNILREEGSDGVWKFLEKQYVSQFGELK
tara:strand:- start:4590 stop:5039 length:450 start_codon:yes stop_codon:yes gene_type:complete